MGAIVRVKPLDGAWQALGSDRYRGIVAQGVELSANPWGPDQASFNVKTVEPAALRPDLLPYTPVEIEIDGILCWAGRVKARPSAEQDHSIQCEGWQYHLDDNPFRRVWVHTRLGDYRDQRSFLGANLTIFKTAGTVSVERGVITLGWPNAAVLSANSSVGVTIDLGEDSTAKRAVLTWESSNNLAGATLQVRGTSTEDATGAGDVPITFNLASGASGTTAGTFATARRYVHIRITHIAGATLAADTWFRVLGLKLFRSTAYESGNSSILEADDIWKDALANALLLNQSQTAITDGTFSIPEYLTDGYQSPKDVSETVNALENYRLKIGGADLKTFQADPKPDVPLYEVGAWSGSEFADASVSGEDIYTTVIVTGTGPDGGDLVSTRTQTGTLVDRQGGTRTKVLPIRSAMTQAVADRIGDLWLLEHRTAPFAGKLSATSGIRRYLGGASVPPYELLRAAGEKIRLAHRIDPDTGAQGRDGTIAGVSYSHDSRAVSIDIDDRREHFETVISRYGALVDQFT